MDDGDEKYLPLRIENQLGFALYAAVHSVTKIYRDKLVQVGLTYPQYLVLAVLWEEDGIRISDIGQRLKLDSGTLTPLIRRLERDGFIRRQRSDEDERVVRVYLREEGVQLKDYALESRVYVGQRLKMSQQEINEMRIKLLDLVDTIREEDAKLKEDAEVS